MSSDSVLIDRIQSGELDAWEELIARFEGRLLAFVESRLGRRDAGEDVVQETFIGFLTSLPNYDTARPLESYLFSIAAHKLTDHLRREGRRPTLPLTTGHSSLGEIDLPGKDRPASSILRSGERRQIEDRGSRNPSALPSKSSWLEESREVGESQMRRTAVRRRLAEQARGRVAGDYRAGGRQSEIRIARASPLVTSQTAIISGSVSRVVTSFPGSAWERTAAEAPPPELPLSDAMCEPQINEKVTRIRGGASGTVWSQAEPGTKNGADE